MECIILAEERLAGGAGSAAYPIVMQIEPQVVGKGGVRLPPVQHDPLPSNVSEYATLDPLDRGWFMNARDFRRIALSLEGAEEGSHMGAVDFRVGGRIFATLASVKQGYGNLMLNLEQQALFVEEMPEVFLPIPGGWGRMGMTHIRLAKATEDVLAGALRAAWNLRVDKNAKTGKKANPRKGSRSRVR